MKIALSLRPIFIAPAATMSNATQAGDGSSILPANVRYVVQEAE
ncbi:MULTISPECIES: hypothetical protein [Pseudomonas]|nr:hypothetical protein [Pseudomonas fuscovaginae]